MYISMIYIFFILCIIYVKPTGHIIFDYVGMWLVRLKHWLPRTTWLFISMVLLLGDRCPALVGWRNATRWLTEGQRAYLLISSTNFYHVYLLISSTNFYHVNLLITSTNFYHVNLLISSTNFYHVNLLISSTNFYCVNVLISSTNFYHVNLLISSSTNFYCVSLLISSINFYCLLVLPICHHDHNWEYSEV